MKGRSLLLIACSIAAISGCTRPGVGKPYPLEIRSGVTGVGSAELVEALKSEAYASRRYRPAKEADSDRAIVMTVRAVEGPIEPGGQPGFTYLIDWTRKGAEIGAVKADCVTGYFASCADIAVDTMTGQLWPQRR
jgi:hypothetical protein